MHTMLLFLLVCDLVFYFLQCKYSTATTYSLRLHRLFSMYQWKKQLNSGDLSCWHNYGIYGVVLTACQMQWSESTSVFSTSVKEVWCAVVRSHKVCSLSVEKWYPANDEAPHNIKMRQIILFFFTVDIFFPNSYKKALLKNIEKNILNYIHIFIRCVYLDFSHVPKDLYHVPKDHSLWIAILSHTTVPAGRLEISWL